MCEREARARFRKWFRACALPGCWECGSTDPQLPGFDACETCRRARYVPTDRMPPIVPPLDGRRAQVEETPWARADARGVDVQLFRMLPEAVQQAYELAIAECWDSGRAADADRLIKCAAKAETAQYWCPEHREFHEEVQGKCGWRGCPVCGERPARRQRENTWAAFGDLDWVWYWVVTVPPELRDAHGPDRFSEWAKKLVRWIEAEFRRRWKLIPCGVVVPHWTGEKTAGAGTFHPHYNIIITNRARCIRSGRVVKLDEIGLRPRMRKADLKRWRHGLAGALGITRRRANAHLESKADLPQAMHTVSYTIRPTGDGYPDMRARWTWTYCRSVRPFGTIATGRAGQWAADNPASERVKSMGKLVRDGDGSGGVSYCRAAAAEGRQVLCRGFIATHLLDRTERYIDPELAGAARAFEHGYGTIEEINHVIRDISAGVPPASMRGGTGPPGGTTDGREAEAHHDRAGDQGSRAGPAPDLGASGGGRPAD